MSFLHIATYPVPGQDGKIALTMRSLAPGRTAVAMAFTVAPSAALVDRETIRISAPLATSIAERRALPN